MKWLEDADKSRIGLWATYHPGEVGRKRFLARCAELDARGVRYSVGVVGKKGHFEDIEALRAALPAHVYLWVNAFKVGAGYYSEVDLARLGAVDPLFEVNTRRYRTRGLPCGAGETVISVEGDGTARRCHFIERPIGNIYAQDVRELLRPRLCSRVGCECHIGYVHLSEMDAAQVYGDGLLARIPDPTVWADRERLEGYLERARKLGNRHSPPLPQATRSHENPSPLGGGLAEESLRLNHRLIQPRVVKPRQPRRRGLGTGNCGGTRRV